MDIFSKEKRSDIMSKVRNKDSKIEILLRKVLWKNGFRYRKNSTKYFGKPDIVLPKYKTVIFVDSCFWHKCPQHYGAPTTRKKFWEKKIEGNKKRDMEVNKYYTKTHWTLIRVWEHKLKQSLEQTIRKLLKSLDIKAGIRNRNRLHSHMPRS